MVSYLGFTQYNIRQPKGTMLDVFIPTDRPEPKDIQTTLINSWKKCHVITLQNLEQVILGGKFAWQML